MSSFYNLQVILHKYIFSNIGEFVNHTDHLSLSLCVCVCNMNLPRSIQIFVHIIKFYLVILRNMNSVLKLIWY